MAKADKRSNTETDYDSMRAKKLKWSKSIQQPSQMGDMPDSEEDLGHSTRVKFLAAAKEPAKRSYPVVSNLKITVEEGKQKLASSLERKVHGVTEREFELKDTLIKFILYAERDQPEADDSGVKQSSIAKLTAPAIYRRAKFTLASSRELLVQYERASQQVAFSKGVSSMESGWEKDNETLQHILDKQKEMTKLELQQLLGKHSKFSKEQVQGEVSKSDTDLWDHFGVGETRMESVEALRRKGETWAAVAKNAHRGVQRALKDLPEGDERCPQ